jgi:hypothetical protein
MTVVNWVGEHASRGNAIAVRTGLLVLLLLGVATTVLVLTQGLEDLVDMIAHSG